MTSAEDESRHQPAVGPAPGPAVAFYFYRLSAAGGGAERMVCQLAGAMARAGFRVLVITWDPADATSFYPIEPGVRWVRLGFAPGLVDKVRRVRALRDALTHADVRVLIGFVMSGDRTVYMAARLAGVRLVAAERNAPQMYAYRYNRLQRWLTFRLLGLTDRIAIQMPNFAAGYPSRLRARMVSIPNPVQPARQHASPERADARGRYTLLAVSRLDAEQKRIDCLLRAFGRLAAAFPAWDLRIVGDGPARPVLQEQVVALGLADRVRIEPSTPDICAVYVQSHLFVIPSRWEGFPNALAEAMSHGLPAVGFTMAAGVAELIGAAGWLADGLDDSDALAAALSEAMVDGNERLRRGGLAVRHMAQFAPELQFERWSGLLRNLAAE